MDKNFESKSFYIHNWQILKDHKERVDTIEELYEINEKLYKNYLKKHLWADGGTAEEFIDEIFAKEGKEKWLGALVVIFLNTSMEKLRMYIKELNE
ncbi:hypothetical protein H6F78_12445 [Coleofasciculus sp. FACHB-64]|uniref:hypothetical protein n=1 Tax=Cyanophyceae TaxID=3028117 RepID=UPI00168A1402|nr:MULTISPECIES: hypothetical protein [unclassified Coleofasciculus]MBD1836996.1 hypothetical protein [Coleofasciculus sp. FACHB-501]MBD2046390.1 hypothetical protein [Coleofasciculus sp. FACHB-64]